MKEIIFWFSKHKIKNYWLNYAIDFLGKSLNYYLIGILILYILLITNRLIRFWIKHSLMYMLDFIYFGNINLIRG